MIRWPAVLAGFVAAVVPLLVVGMLLGRAPIDENPGLLALPSFVALFAGGYVAGRLARRAGPTHGIAVAVIYIFLAASIKALRLWRAGPVSSLRNRAMPSRWSRWLSRLMPEGRVLLRISTCWLVLVRIAPALLICARSALTP